MSEHRGYLAAEDRWPGTAVVILTSKVRSFCKSLAFSFFGFEKKVGGASDLSRGGGFAPPPSPVPHRIGIKNTRMEKCQLELKKKLD